MEDEALADTDKDLEPWSAEQRLELRRALEARRQRQIVGARAFAGILLALVAGGVLLRLDPGYWIPAVGVVALAALAFSLTNWKCPACGERLPTRSSKASCFGCGLPLE